MLTSGQPALGGALARKAIEKNAHLIDVWKLFLPVAGSGRERERSGIDLVLGPSLIGEPGSVCTQTYLVAGPLPNNVTTGVSGHVLAFSTASVSDFRMSGYAKIGSSW